MSCRAVNVQLFHHNRWGSKTIRTQPVVRAECRWNAAKLRERNVFPDWLIKSVWWSLRGAKALPHPQLSECYWEPGQEESQGGNLPSWWSNHPQLIQLVPRLCQGHFPEAWWHHQKILRPHTSHLKRTFWVTISINHRTRGRVYVSFY